MSRTINKFIAVYLDDSGGTLRQLTSVNNVGGIGLDQDEVDSTAWADTLKGVLLGMPSFTTTIGGVFDTVDHGYLTGVDGLNTPLSFDVRVGLLAAWTSGNPQFGITSSATAGVLVKGYTFDPNAMTWTATIVMFPGSTAPDWGTAAET